MREVLEIIGNVEGKNCLIVDDFTISGGTLINLAKGLEGARRTGHHRDAQPQHHLPSRR